MSKNLFRQQALDFQKNRLWGDVLLIQPLSHYLFSFFAIAIIALLGYYVATGEYSRKAKVRGYLVPDKGLIKVYAQRNGVVTRVHFDKGNFVEKGKPLFTLNVQLGLVKGGDIDSSLLNELTRLFSALVR